MFKWVSNQGVGPERSLQRKWCGAAAASCAICYCSAFCCIGRHPAEAGGGQGAGGCCSCRCRVRCQVVVLACCTVLCARCTLLHGALYMVHGIICTLRVIQVAPGVPGSTAIVMTAAGTALIQHRIADIRVSRRCSRGKRWRWTRRSITQRTGVIVVNGGATSVAAVQAITLRGGQNVH
jgi:hypothetical protein